MRNGAAASIAAYSRCSTLSGRSLQFEFCSSFARDAPRNVSQARRSDEAWRAVGACGLCVRGYRARRGQRLMHTRVGGSVWSARRTEVAQILKIPVSFCSKNVVHRRLRVRRTHPHTFVLQGGATTPRPRARRLQSDLTARKHLEQTTCSAGSSMREWITPSPRHCCNPRVLCMDYSGLQITGQPYATTGTCVCGVLVGNRPIRRWLRR